jgi:YegS/Rv2252/BmrU family lipid kinase
MARALSSEGTEVPEQSSVLLVNTHSRQGRDQFSSAVATFRELETNLTRAVACARFERLLLEARRAVEARVPVLFVGGGDGTVGAVANLTIGTETALAVIPLGTGNAVARDLGIPFETAAACQALVQGKRVRIDAGQVNGRLFLNVATVGLTTSIVRSLTEPLKRRFGRAAYVYAVLRSLRHIRPFQVELRSENGTSRFDSIQVVIGNGRYHAGPFPVAPCAGIASGHLEFYALRPCSRASLLRFAFSLPLGEQVDLEEVHAESVLEGELKVKPAMKAVIDGELGPVPPLRFSVRPRELEVIVPRDFEI